MLNLNPNTINIMPTSEWFRFIFTAMPLIFLYRGKTEFCIKYTFTGNLANSTFTGNLQHQNESPRE